MSYVWSFPGCPVRIELSIRFVARLLEAIHPEPEAAAAGLLIGRAASPTSIEVKDFLAVPVTTLGGRPIPPEEWDAVAQAKKAAIGKAGLHAVGVFRTQREGAMRLEADDLALMRAHFPGPGDVFLLLRRSSGGECTAGFFFWDNGHIEGGFSYNEFPFDSERLRRDSAAQRSLEPAILDAPVAAVADQLLEKPLRARRPGALARLALAASLALNGVAVYYWSADRLGARGTPLLGMEARAQGGNVHLTWDRQAAILQSGAQGLLTILDGESLQEVRLDREDLRTIGHLAYAPASREVRFRLQILGVDGQSLASESIVAAGRGWGSRTASGGAHPASASPGALLVK